MIVHFSKIDMKRATNPEKIFVAGITSLTGTLVSGSSCQNTGRRRGRGEKVNTSYPTAYTPLVMGA